jgi:hypothetical protein
MGYRVNKKTNPISEDLIAPCGMNCAICSNHLAYVNKLKRSQCTGCRSRKSKCTYLFGKCTGVNHSAGSTAVFCYECDQYPCKQIDRIDSRYKKNYNMSMKDNLEYIRKNGVAKFVKEQYEKYRCSRCSAVISIHIKKCFKCDEIKKLIEKI